jgi:hypothetical protein
MEIFIPGNVPSSKNSRMRTRSGIFIKSPLCFKYEKATKVIWEEKAEEVRQLTDNAEKPILIGLHFVRDSKRKCDFHNLVQFIADLMVKYKWIEDDNMTQVFFVPYIRNGTYYSVNKDEYGVWIKV